MKSMQKGFTLIELMIVVAIIGILAAIAIPQYQTYIAKSQVSRVMSETGSVKTAVENCILNGQVTQDACELGWTRSNLLGGTQTTGQTGLVVTIDETGAGTSTIAATFGNNAATALKVNGKNGLTWTRSAAGSWTCTSTVEEKYKPAGCMGSGS